MFVCCIQSHVEEKKSKKGMLGKRTSLYSRKTMNSKITFFLQQLKLSTKLFRTKIGKEALLDFEPLLWPSG